MIIGITGSIGSGKTTVAKIFSKHWYNRIDADEIGHQIMKKNPIVYKKIINYFGNKILDTRENRRFSVPRNFKKISRENKNINRNKLGDIAFNNNKKLLKLNTITHPIIINEIKNQIEKIQNKCGDNTKVIIDAPLLLETKTKDLIDKIIVIKCNKNNILKRLNKKYPKEKIERILNAQMPLDEKLKHADFIVDNNKDLKHLEKQVKKIIEKLNQK